MGKRLSVRVRNVTTYLIRIQKRFKCHLAKNGFVTDYEIWRFQGEISLPIAEDKNLDTAEASSTNNKILTENPPNREAQQPYDMLNDAHRELWPGCETHSQLSLAVSLMIWKAEHNVSEKCFNQCVRLMKDAAPKGNLVPSSFSETKKLLRGVGLPIRKIN